VYLIQLQEGYDGNYAFSSLYLSSALVEET